MVSKDKEIKLAAFADDLTTFVQGVKSFERLSLTLNSFGICSGLKLKAEKTKALWLGSNIINGSTLQINIEKVNKPVTILGIFFTYDLRKKQELNFDETTEIAIENLKRVTLEESYFI